LKKVNMLLSSTEDRPVRIVILTVLTRITYVINKMLVSYIFRILS